MSVPQFLQHYKDKGFNFSSKVLTKYCLSLYTKPFVILSGISGTGKTKIAQLFEVFVDEAIQEEPAPAALQNFGYIILNVTSGVLNGDGRGNFKFKDLKSIFEEDEIDDIQAEISKLRQQNNNGNITPLETFTIDTKDGEFKVGIYLQRAGNPLLRVRFKTTRGNDQYDSQQFLKDHFKEGDTLKLEKVGRRRLKLTGINDQDVKEVNEVLDRRETELIDNKLFVSVKSNWTDNSELFGYYNILEEKYNLTPVLKFMMTAREHPAKPFFLILDEMNLSKVEHYFSDFLSCLESRIELEDGSIKQEDIRLHNYSSFVESNDNYFDLVPNSVGIPYNLYVTGTVNIDETTYAFSPKVLDRANVIEFNEVNVSSYDAAQANGRFTLNSFPEFGVAQIATSKAFLASPEEYKACVKDLLDILQPYNLHFGYRVINEMALFVTNATTYVGNEPVVISDAIDIQITQKVLPKFSGAFGKLDEPLRKLIAYMVKDAAVDYNQITIDYVSNINPQQSAFPESLAKICRLYTNLIYNGFASFLE